MQIGDHDVTKFVFSESLKPDGWLSSFVMDVQCEVWCSHWSAKIFLTNFTAVSSNFA
jgi:hypothetical protein